MDFSWTSEEKELRSVLASALDKECPPEVVRETEASARGWCPTLWNTLVGMGIVAETIEGDPTRRGLRAALVAEELGRVLGPVPFVEVAVLAGTLLVASGSPAAGVLRDVVEDGVAITLCPPGRGGGRVTNGRFDGTFDLVPLGGTASAHLVFVADAGMALVEAAGEWAVAQQRPNLAGIPLARLSWKGAPARVLLTPGAARTAHRLAVGRAAVARCAWLVGAAQACLDMAIGYARERFQFGKPVGSNQAIQHRLADLGTRLYGARWMALEAAWALDRKQAAAVVIPGVKAYVGEIAAEAAAYAHQVFGAYGFTLESDVQLYSRRVKAEQVLLGRPETLYRQVGQAVLGAAQPPPGVVSMRRELVRREGLAPALDPLGFHD